jgi:hypothetical protein
MRSTGLSAADWSVITEYLEVLKPLKLATKRLEGRGSGQYGAIYEIISVYEYLLGYYEQRITSYSDVVYDEHNEAPEDHLAINLRAAWAKASDYYAKLDASPAYYAATILHPYYKTYCDLAWADRLDWLDANNRAFKELWGQYKSAPSVVRPPRIVTNDIDDAIDSLMEPTKSLGPSPNDLDEYERWKQCEPRAEKGSDAANNPIKYWVEQRNRYPSYLDLRWTFYLYLPQVATASACLMSLAICSNRGGEVYQLSFWLRYSAYGGGKKLVLGPLTAPF